VTRLKLWEWDSGSASGVGDENGAREGAERHLRRQLPGARALLSEVRLVVGADLEGAYARTGRTVTATREADGSIAWP
jgi:hypothetical protein